MLSNDQFTLYAERHLDTVYRVALHYLKSADYAEDVTQNVFLKLLRERKPFENDQHVRNWLIRVTLNECKNLVRKHWWHDESYDDYAGKLCFDSPKHYEVLSAVMELPKRYRLPIYSHYYEDHTTQEIADLLKIPKSTVCTQLKRGRDLLKQVLAEEGSYV